MGMNTERLIHLQARLEAWGLTSWAVLALDAFEPLRPFLGQALWVLQPSLSLVMERQQVADWAHFMEDPHALAQLKAHLAEESADE
jgi:hypothetical protein